MEISKAIKLERGIGEIMQRALKDRQPKIPSITAEVNGVSPKALNQSYVCIESHFFKGNLAFKRESVLERKGTADH